MFSEVMQLKIKVRKGPYAKRDSGTHCLELVDIVEKLKSKGYSITEKERGERGGSIPVINLNLKAGPDVATEMTLPIDLELEPHRKKHKLNVLITLSGLRAQLDTMGYKVKRQGNLEFSTRVFIPDFDDGYLTPDQGDDPDNRPRERVMREIAARRGATAFRNSQLARFGQRCAISGCTLGDVLEAAHIRAYRAEGDNNPNNGILLRSDLHTLFDLDLLAVNPSGQRVAIHASVHEGQYTKFNGRKLSVTPTDGFDEDAVKQRWTIFRARR
jgi:HNH endonuclease